MQRKSTNLSKWIFLAVSYCIYYAFNVILVLIKQTTKPPVNTNFYNFFGLNETLFIQINQLTNKGFIPDILNAVSSVFFIANFAACYIAVCIYFYFKTKKAVNSETYFTPIYTELFRIGTCYAIFGFIFAGLKFSVNMPRPFCSLDPSQFTTIANTELERCLSSFPSAHTGLSILVTYALWPHLNKSAKLFCCIVIALVATSRITLAMHYPADIAYSALATLFVIIIGNLIYKAIKPKIADPIKKLITKLFFS
jgi:membrane-associated phospholipid phosphatase